MRLTTDVVGAAFEAMISGGVGTVHVSNWSLVGHQNVPTVPIALAVLYPLAEGPGYAAVRLPSDDRSISDGEIREHIRDRILEVAVPERVEMAQAEAEVLLRSSLSADAHHRSVVLAAHQEGLPIAMVMFGIAQCDGTETIHIYHPSNIATRVALEMMKEAVRDAVRGE